MCIVLPTRNAKAMYVSAQLTGKMFPVHPTRRPAYQDSAPAAIQMAPYAPATISAPASIAPTVFAPPRTVLDEKAITAITMIINIPIISKYQLKFKDVLR